MWKLAVAAGLVWLFWPRVAKAKPTEDPTEPDEPSDEPTIIAVIEPLISDAPRPGAAYQVRQGEILYGNGGIIARALRSVDASDTGADRVAYYQAITRVRSNWRLYGTLRGPHTPAIERVVVRSAAGDVDTGTITAALCVRHDRWLSAAAQGDLPARLIGWTRSQATGACASVRNRQGWQSLRHGSRTYGLLWLPPLEAVDLGLDVTDRPDMDWPAALYEAAGTTWEAAFT